jgi:hypothetical protein
MSMELFIDICSPYGIIKKGRYEEEEGRKTSGNIEL